MNENKRAVVAAFRHHYADVRRLARWRLRRESAPVSTGTLAHELFLQLERRDDLAFGSTREFMAYAGSAMRSLLVDMARARAAQKRHAPLATLDEDADLADADLGSPDGSLAVKQAMQRLACADPDLLAVVELRGLLGLSVEATAHELGVSVPTVKRRWARAKAFLVDALDADGRAAAVPG